MKSLVYLETTVPSYLTAWPSRDLVRAAHQQITREWWQRRRGEFELFISQVVLRECQAGDPDAAAQRLQVLRDLPLLEQSEEATALAEALVGQVPLPERAAVDALHIAIAAMHGMDFCLRGIVLTSPTRRCVAKSRLSAARAATNHRRFARPKNCYRRRAQNMDNVLQEVRQIREAYAKQFGYDLQAIHRDLKEQERASGRRVVSLPPRRPKVVLSKAESHT